MGDFQYKVDDMARVKRTFCFGNGTLILALMTLVSCSTSFKTVDTALILSNDKLIVAEEAAMRGDPDAARRLLNHYEIGLRDEKRALPWLRIGAENGASDLQWLLAYKLLVTASDINERKQSLEWYRIAIENGNTDALVELTSFYLEGKFGLPTDQTITTCLQNIVDTSQQAPIYIAEEGQELEAPTPLQKIKMNCDLRP